MGIFSKLFGSKQQEKITTSYNGEPLVGDFSFLGTDIHSHFIPGIDDGAQTVEDSIELITRLQNLGYQRIVTTPHIKVDHYPNTSAIIRNGLEEVKEALAERGMDIPVHAAAEYYIDDHFMNILETEPLLTIWKNEVLVEISFMFEPIQLNEILFKLTSKGYQPIMAHPERYMYYHQDFDKYEALKDRGCYLQMNINSLLGYYGKGVKQVAERLFAMGLYDYVGADMHHVKHAEVVQNIANTPEIMALLQSKPLRNPLIQF
mgnify:CR=1 FL=1